MATLQLAAKEGVFWMSEDEAARSGTSRSPASARAVAGLVFFFPSLKQKSKRKKKKEKKKKSNFRYAALK